MARPRGRPALDSLDRMALEGRYLIARHDLTMLNERLPTVADIAEYMELSPRTVEAIRAGMRAWRREASAMLGWQDWPDDSLHPHDGATSARAQILDAYAVGELTTADAARELALLGLPADAGELRRWRRGLHIPE